MGYAYDPELAAALAMMPPFSIADLPVARAQFEAIMATVPADPRIDQLHIIDQVIPGPDRARTPDRVAPPSIERPVRVNEHIVGTVWLERPGEPGPLDEMVIERMAAAAGALWPAVSPAVSLADPGLIELAVSPSANLTDRTRGPRLLGFDPQMTMRAFALAAPAPDVAAAAFVRQLRGESLQIARAAVIGAYAVVLTRWCTCTTAPWPAACTV